MGGPMCRRLVAAGHSVTAYDVDADALAAVVGCRGRRLQSSAIECARGADLFMTSLPGPPQVEAVMVWTRRRARRAEAGLGVGGPHHQQPRAGAGAGFATAPDRVAVVDSPVTGAVDGARAGRHLLCSRAANRVAVASVAAGSGASRYRHRVRAPRFAGNVVKLVTNQLWFAAAAALGEGFAVGLANGVELGDAVARPILDSVGDSFVARHDAPSIFAGHYDPSFPLALCVKDLGLLADLESSVDADLPMTAAARSAFERAARRYGMEAGEMCVARRIEDDSGVSMRLEGDWTPHWKK